MDQHRLEQERQGRLRKSALFVNVSVKDQHGHICQGTIFVVSEGEVGLLMESSPGSEQLELQPENSPLRISVLTKHCSPVSSGYLVGCAFPFPPTLEILQALSAPRKSALADKVRSVLG
jgi:hypothetical protein